MGHIEIKSVIAPNTSKLVPLEFHSVVVGYHVRLTRERSPVRARAELSFFHIMEYEDHLSNHLSAIRNDVKSVPERHSKELASNAANYAMSLFLLLST